MNNLLSYCGLVDAKIRASDKDLPVQNQEMRGLLRQNNLNESLLEEVQKLRMENAELKSTPFVAKISQNTNPKME